jgi:hypothetical protein
MFKIARLLEQQLMAKKKIMDWRITELQELRKQAEFYDERCIMNDGAINLLSARFGDIVIAEDISAVVDWSELVQGSKQRLTNILVEFNQEIEIQLSSSSLRKHSISDPAPALHRNQKDKRARQTPDLQSNAQCNKRNKSTTV